MKISKLILGFVAISVLLAIAVVVLTSRLGDALRSIEQAQDRRHASYLLADELRQSSDDLTRFARTYVVMGEERYERFFQQVLNIRNGVIPRPKGYGGVYWDSVAAGEVPEPVQGVGERSSLEQRMSAVGFTEAEFELLREAQSRSDELAGLENVAMNAVKGLFDDGAGNFTVQGEPDREKAAALLHGSRYHDSKAQIMQPIGQFLQMVDERTSLELTGLNGSAWNLFLGLFVTGGLLAAILFAMAAILYLRVVKRVNALVMTANRIAQGDLSVRSQLEGRDELAILGGTFNGMVDQLSGALHQAKAETEEVQSRMEVIFERALDGILMISKESLKIETLNPAAETMFGAAAAEISGEPVLRILSPPVVGDSDGRASTGPVQGWFRAAAESTNPVEAIGRTLTGKEFPVEAVVSEAQIADSPVFICTTRDISAGKQLADKRNAELKRLSTPVSQIWEGLLLLPLVGSVDSERADAVLEATLEGITASKAEVFILDISGVTEMDVQVASYLAKVAKASQLMGCECIISGVSPMVAHNLVDLGVNLGDVRTTATMKDALARAFKHLGIRFS